MKTAVLVLKMAKTVPYRENVDYIGVDAGTLVCLREHLPVTYAVGDFDSVNQEQWEYIQKMVPQIEKLNPIKDDSDSEHAIKRALREGYERIEIYGGLGGRVDHEIVNIRLACAYPEKVYLMSKKNELYAVREGTYIFSKLDSRFISFFTDTKAVISLKGFAYDISHREIDYAETYTVSNEVKQEQAELIVEKGTVLVVKTND